ncbi:COG4315 family predicted lipoprotein [Pseudomonas silesiensis]|jgi:predicted lipoprotein with Yx(FWY)xxD motif|uniref:Lipoprotein with Yx(FWY)xxD motif n=1 Tax=Pseudomonas silesiensis TaxID=1853130 RepID=A0A191Z2B3_9PSED|nr:hypothetical protein [Pseudomonas silesiensis]ANJ59108.1 hypothetical protein PMA3_29635 [Pseudomonas silesiensis]
MKHIAKSWKALLVTAALTLPTMAFAADPGMVKGGMMTDHKGMTLYTFDNDAGGKSACTGKCAENWPPLKATEADKAEGKWSIIKRDDGTMQWAFDGKPLYYFVQDKKPGDMTGDKKMDKWHILQGPKM